VMGGCGGDVREPEDTGRSTGWESEELSCERRVGRGGGREEGARGHERDGVRNRGVSGGLVR
jgi:hypothetical protein